MNFHYNNLQNYLNIIFPLKKGQTDAVVNFCQTKKHKFVLSFSSQFSPDLQTEIKILVNSELWYSH